MHNTSTILALGSASIVGVVLLWAFQPPSPEELAQRQVALAEARTEVARLAAAEARYRAEEVRYQVEARHNTPLAPPAVQWAGEAQQLDESQGLLMAYDSLREGWVHCMEGTYNVQNPLCLGHISRWAEVDCPAVREARHNTPLAPPAVELVVEPAAQRPSEESFTWIHAWVLMHSIFFLGFCIWAFFGHWRDRTPDLAPENGIL